MEKGKTGYYLISFILVVKIKYALHLGLSWTFRNNLPYILYSGCRSFFKGVLLKCIPKTGIDALTECNKEIYPNIYLLLKILCTLPVSTTTPERMFSALKRVKTYLRNTMTEVSSS